MLTITYQGREIQLKPTMLKIINLDVIDGIRIEGKLLDWYREVADYAKQHRDNYTLWDFLKELQQFELEDLAKLEDWISILYFFMLIFLLSYYQLRIIINYEYRKKDKKAVC